jgi:hypothetical protein
MPESNSDCGHNAPGDGWGKQQEEDRHPTVFAICQILLEFWSVVGVKC